jgi:antitoxin (DNA-binding transcriptional repressor) of toxin-antitoxin stability system
VRRRRKVIARLVPVGRKTGAYPDFAARSKKIFRDKVTSQTGTELVAEERDRY